MATVVEAEHVRIAHERQIAILRGMTPQQRIQQAIRMNRTMRKLLAAGFRDRHPSWTDARIEHAVADRILHARTG